MNKQHVQLPNNMEKSELSPKDQLIYLSIRRFMDKNTHIAYPSLAKISELSGASIPTVRSSISRLEEKDYLQVVKKARGQYYIFNELKKFEPFSYEFLDRNDISFTAKSYIVASQQFMYKDVEGLGKMSYSDRELSSKMNMPQTTISKCNRELEMKGYLSILDNKSRDIESGCKTTTKVFHLEKLGQAIIWALKNHEERLVDHEERLKKLEEELLLKNKLIEELLDKKKEENKMEFVV